MKPISTPLNQTHNEENTNDWVAKGWRVGWLEDYCSFSLFSCVRASWPYVPPAAPHTSRLRSMHCPSTKIPRSLVPQQNAPVEMLKAFILTNTKMIYGAVFSPSPHAIAFDSSKTCSFVNYVVSEKLQTTRRLFFDIISNATSYSQVFI